MPRPRRLQPQTFLLGLLALAACDAQVGPAYRGEAIATIGGTAEITRDPPPEKLAAFLIWTDLVNAQRGLGARVVFADTFPTGFELPVATPPKSALLTDLTYGGRFPDEARIGIGVVAALPKSAASGADAANAYSGASRYVVVWVERDVQAGTFSAAFLGGQLRRGFYLLEVIPSATYLAAHPEVAACDQAGLADGECPADGPEARAAYIEAARRAAGCLWPRSGADRLAPTSGFDLRLTLAITGTASPLDAPNLL